MAAEDGQLGAQRGPEQPLLSRHDEVDVVVPPEPAGDRHQVGEPLARLEGPDAQEVGLAQPEPGQRRLDDLGLGRSVPRREPVGDDVDPAGIHTRQPGAIGGGGVARDDQRIGPAEQPHPGAAQQPRPPRVAREEEGDEVVDGHHHRDGGAPRLALLDRVVEAGRVVTQRARDQEGIDQHLGPALQPGHARRHPDPAAGELPGGGRSAAQQDPDLGGEADLAHALQQAAQVGPDPPARRITLEGAGIDEDRSHGRSGCRSARLSAPSEMRSSSRRTTAFHR